MNKTFLLTTALLCLSFAIVGCSSVAYNKYDLEPVTMSENVPYVEIFKENENTVARFNIGDYTIETDYRNVSIIQDRNIEKPIAMDCDGKWQLLIPSGKILDLR